jgi:hypothetical protein
LKQHNQTDCTVRAEGGDILYFNDIMLYTYEEERDEKNEMKN